VNAFPHLLNAMFVVAAIYALAVLMRRRGALAEEHSLALARIVTDLCLPATIFATLVRTSVRFDQLGPAALMFALEIGSIALAWSVAALLRFPRSRRGPIVFCAAFGSSSFLGYAVIREMFPAGHEALAEAVLISELGVGYPILILGPLLAAHFGAAPAAAAPEGPPPSPLRSALIFFRSPVFLSFVLGLLWPRLGLPGDKTPLMVPVFRLLDVLAAGLVPLALLSVGLMFRVPHPREIALALTIVVAVKLILKPVAAGLLARAFGFPELWEDVLVLLAGMPPAVLGPVFLRRYGGEAPLASALLISAGLLSCVTLIGTFWLVHHF
jgi:predicted permease